MLAQLKTGGREGEGNYGALKKGPFSDDRLRRFDFFKTCGKVGDDESSSSIPLGYSEERGKFRRKEGGWTVEGLGGTRSRV